MCFSAPASFASAAVLPAAGIVSLRTARTPAQLPFAAIPLLFAVQQAAEGVFWLTLPEGGSPLAGYTFLVFAQVLWPTWVPLAILLLARDRARTPALRATLG